MANERCKFIFPGDHEKAGQQCPAYSTKNTTLCGIHSGGLVRMQENAKKQREKRKLLEDSLNNDIQPLNTVADYGDFIGKVINGIMSGAVKRDKAGLLAMFIPQGVKIAQHLEKTGGPAKVKIHIHNTQIRVMDDARMDEFLGATDAEAVRLLTEVQNQGSIKLSPKKEGSIDVQVVEPMLPEDLKIPAKELAKLSQQTDNPQTIGEIIDLFGVYLGDTEGIGGKKVANPDVSGMGDLFRHNGSGLPTEAQKKPHQWERRHKETVISGLAAEYYACLGCQKEVKSINANYESCPSPLPPDYSKNTVLITVENEDEIDAEIDE